MPASPQISVVVPCLNEKDCIITLLQEIHAQLTPIYSHEIIVVDDNSSDGTFDIIKKENLPYVKAFLRQENPPSLGGSIKFGIEQAKGETVIIMDSDFNHHPKYIPMLIDSLKHFDCVTVSRFVYGSSMGNKFRHIASWLFNMFLRITTRTMITDCLFGFCAIRRDILLQMPLKKIFYGYGDYYIRLMYFLQKNKVTILQVPGIHSPRLAGTPNRSLLKTFFRYLKAVIKISFERT